MQTILQALVAQTADAPGGGVWNLLVMFGLMFAVIYFMMIRPQQKTQKQHREFIGSLKKGDDVVTQGGIFGKIYAVGDGDVTLEVAKDVRIRILKSQVAGYPKGGETSTEKPAEQSVEKAEKK